VDLLARAATVVRPGGRLVYATCSSEPEENEQVVDRTLQERPDLSVVRLDGHPGLAPYVDARGMLRTLPHAHGLEAFFAAVLTRRLGVR
jgi:16S rRNA (cytosine967-C5)-methyltransferase